jgi:putative DNA primase/helicase
MYKINLEEADRFLKLLDPSTKSFLFTSFDDDKERVKRFRAKQGRGVPPGSRRSTLVRIQHWMNGRQKLGANICVSVNAMKGALRRLEEVTYLRAVFAEMDQEALKPWPIAPSIIVETSPGRHHMYWLLDREGESLTRDEFNAVMQRLVEFYGGDKNARDLARTLRMPGSWNQKPGRDPWMARIVSAEGFRYSRGEILKAFPLPAPKPKRQVSSQELEEPSLDEQMERVRNALQSIPCGSDRREWIKIGGALKSSFGESGFALFDGWSKKSDYYDYDGLVATWKSLTRTGSEASTVNSIFWLACKNGWKETRPARAKTIAASSFASEIVYGDVPPPKKRGRPRKAVANGYHALDPEAKKVQKAKIFKGVRDDAAEAGPPHDDREFALKFSEESMALSFAEKYRTRLRFVKPWHTWMDWNGTRWEREDTLKAYDFIRKECRIASAEIMQSGDAEKLGNVLSDLSKGKTRGAIETLARSDRKLAARTDQWDADDWLLNTPGGIIDLRTGQNIGHDPLKYCTKITDVTPDGECPLWLKFLDKVTNSNKELQAYLQRMCGYFLTGSIKEHALFFIHGPGGNGKGVFLNTVSAILAAYHVVSPAQTFAEQKSQRHETELARLDGARLVISQETEQGTYWAEARIKSLTGGDKIAARFMRGDFFEFDPRFKLCIVGNHRPQLRAVDEAIRRRFQLIPFDVEIPDHEKDRDLPTKLKAEYGGILAWMVEGCRKWQAEGLNPPEVVLAATAEYLDAEDAIGCWLSDMCITPKSYPGDPVRQEMHKVAHVRSSETTLKDLFANWKRYADDGHIAARNDKYLGEQLSQRGFKKDRDRRGAFLKGLRLKTNPELVADGISMKEGF